ncbi:helix-turn-helix domain-containing protein [Tepidicaulis sp. LMO-SS28]|uniref:helix-turn-helix domain-containing protein n=1 Tax=Tepidicaulis sp. LMO-SS28 TaxID=3447455 RepID=UPI003EE1DD0B
MRELALVKAVVAEHFGLPQQLLETRFGSRQVSQPRQIACYLARDIFGFSYAEIGAGFGGRDVSTIRSFIAKARDAIGKSSEVAAAAEQARSRVLERWARIPRGGPDQIAARCDALDLLIDTAKAELAELRRLIIQERTSCASFSAGSLNAPCGQPVSNGGGCEQPMAQHQGDAHE